MKRLYLLVAVLLTLLTVGSAHAQQATVFLPALSGKALDVVYVNVRGVEVPVNLNPTAEPTTTTPLTFTPDHGAPGSIVTIAGSGFNNTVMVLFGGTSALFTVDNDTTLRAQVPEGAVSGVVSVITLQNSAQPFTVDTTLPTATAIPPTATTVPPTATATPSLPTPTNTSVPPTATTVPPTATAVPPTATSVPPTATTVPNTPTATPTNPSSITRAVWIDKTALMALPTSGAAWESVLKTANSASSAGSNVSDMGDSQDVAILATALAGVRLNDAALIAKAKTQLANSIDSESDGKWLDVGRNLGDLIIAADILDIRSGPVYDWLVRFKTRTLPHNTGGYQINMMGQVWWSASNADSQIGFVAAALAAYTRDKPMLDEVWVKYRRWVGDTTSPHTLAKNTFGTPWQLNDTDQLRVGILPVGAFKNGLLIDGASTNDSGRSNPNGPKVPLSYNSDSLYPWVGYNGAISAAVVLHRQGYPAFAIQDQALKRFAIRMMEWKKQFGNDWWYTDKKEDAKWFAHIAYDLPLDQYPISLPVGPHDLVGWNDWTHPDKASLN